MRFSFPFVACVALACNPSDPEGPDDTTHDAGDAGSSDADASTPSDASDAPVGSDATDDSSDGGGSDATGDGSAPPIGSPGYCESQYKGSSTLVLGSTGVSGARLYRIRPEGQWDEFVTRFLYQGKDAPLADIAFSGAAYYLTNGVAWWTIPIPLPTGDVELGPPSATGPTGTPPTVAFVIGNSPFVGRGGTTLIQVSPGSQVDWKPNGSVSGPGASCTAMRDFLSGSVTGNVFTFLATCGTDPNAVVTATVGQNGDGGAWIGSSSIGTLPDSQGVDGEVVAVKGALYLTQNKIYSQGAFVRNIKVCVADGNVAGTIAGLRAIVE